MAKFDLNDDGVVVIVGSGAGGGTLGNELAQKGIKVVILEAGARNEIQDFINNEWESFTQLAWKDMRTTSGSWQVAKDFPNLPAWIVKSVGGSTVHWAGASLRFDEHEFKIRSAYGDVPGANMLDWPITLAEMEPWYAKAENKMGVTRTNGIPGLPGNNNFKVMEAGARKVGYKEVHTGRMAINSQPRDGRGSCQQIGFCFQGCKSGAKWSTLYTEIPKGEATGNLEVRPNSMAIKIEHDASGKVTGVVYADAEGKQQRGVWTGAASALLAKPGSLRQDTTLQLRLVRPTARVIQDVGRVLAHRQQCQEVIDGVRRLLRRRDVGQRLPVHQHAVKAQPQLSVEPQPGGRVFAGVAQFIAVIDRFDRDVCEGEERLRGIAAAMPGEARPARPTVGSRRRQRDGHVAVAHVVRLHIETRAGKRRTVGSGEIGEVGAPVDDARQQRPADVEDDHDASVTQYQPAISRVDRRHPFEEPSERPAMNWRCRMT